MIFRLNHKECEALNIKKNIMLQNEKKQDNFSSNNWNGYYCFYSL